MWVANNISYPNYTAQDGDMKLDNSGNVSYYRNGNWIYYNNIKGPQGIQGIQGEQGIQGPQGVQGPQGPKGDVGGFIHIAGKLANVGQLPTPSSLGDLTIAYLVGDSENLYVQIGDNSDNAVWTDTGPLNVSTLVYVDGVAQNTWDADTKVNKVTAANILYGTNSQGDPTNYKIVMGGRTSSEFANSIVKRNSSGYVLTYKPSITSSDSTISVPIGYLNDRLDGYYKGFSVVNSLPGTPDENTIYLIKET